MTSLRDINIAERDAMLRTLDTLTLRILGDQWTTASHILIKGLLLKLIETEDNQ